MLMSLKNIRIELPDEKQLAFRNAQEIQLECTEGMVWLTIEGQPGDFFLSSGERLRIESNGLALVQGSPSGAVRLISESICSIRRVDQFNWLMDLLVFLSRNVCVNRARENIL